ncbi:hypothetical protein [Nocardiopsis ganjiahuensis]|uniref:hypothetical protein n=1 Tax=Nocardiopsis ganjiahuensis TaxID=239984 RepID=UPI00034C5E20|nr:hypothetical protein [Nocardiopsis ganjiahuensis]
MNDPSGAPRENVSATPVENVAGIGPRNRALRALNTDGHRLCLRIYLVVVVAHWAEHIVQAVQVYVLDWPVPEARGVLGIPFPWLVTSEWMHYGYAFVMLVGLLLLLPGFHGRSRAWWTASLLLQVWHHFEHLILLVQVTNGANIGGGDAPVSIVQMLIPRVELHLFYNTVVFVPMAVAMYLHSRPDTAGREAPGCSCAREPGRVRG